MKLLSLALFMVFFGLDAHAAFTRCTYQETPCNEQGDHYYCEMYGWANASFCSDSDRSTRRLNAIDVQKPTYFCEENGCFHVDSEEELIEIP